MGSRYLTDLADVCRSIGAWVHEEPGWQTRARGSGGYESGRPTHVMCHHTASAPSSDGQADVNYMCYGSSDKPIANLYISRTGEVWVMAAGATNTNGKGHDYWGGGVPNDSMNSYAIGIEAGNNGVGEVWPAQQQDIYIRLVNGLCEHYGIPIGHVRAHFEWAPDRKIDPAGQSRYATGSAKWNMDQFRGDCATLSPQPPQPEPPQPQPEPPPTTWVCPPFPGTGDYGCSYDTCRAWQDAMILNHFITDNVSNHDGVWGNGMHNACLKMQQSWGWDDADGVGGKHTWPHLRSRDVAPCPTCGK